MSEPVWLTEWFAHPVADVAEWRDHAARFVDAFVVASKRERWRWLLTTRPKRLGADSHKLHTDLDRRVCRPIPGWPPRLKGTGLLERFEDQPRRVPLDQAWRHSGGGDALPLIHPGELSIFLFHQAELWLCQSPGTFR